MLHIRNNITDSKVRVFILREDMTVFVSKDEYVDGDRLQEYRSSIDIQPEEELFIYGVNPR